MNSIKACALYPATDHLTCFGDIFAKISAEVGEGNTTVSCDEHVDVDKGKMLDNSQC